MFAFFSEENTEAILVSQVIQNYVGLSSSLRIRKSKSLAFVGCPTISIILTLESCDKQKYPSGYLYKLFAIYKTQSMIARRD